MFQVTLLLKLRLIRHVALTSIGLHRYMAGRYPD